MTTGLTELSDKTAQSLSAIPKRRRNPNSTVGRKLWWFVLPALVFYIFIVIVPTVQGVGLSLTSWSAFSRDRDFVGLDNYIRMLGGANANAIAQTLILAAATMILQNVVGLLLALALNGPIRGRNVLRTLIFAPVVVSPLVCGYLFKYIFGPQGIGAVNAFLSSIGLPERDWLGDPQTALSIIVIVVCWQFTGISMVIYLAALQSVPPELLEAAALDGAGAFKRFRHVTAPLLAPGFTINLMLSLIGGLKIFDQIWAMTQGGPGGATETISTLIYRKFSQVGEYGQSVALAVILAIVVAVFSAIQFIVLRRREMNQ